MTPEQLSDLAYDFVNIKIVRNYNLIKKYLLDNNGKLEDLDYFFVFIRHWEQNTYDLEWSDIIMEHSFDMNKQ